MRYWVIIFFLTGTFQIACAQWYDAQWIMGPNDSVVAGGNTKDYLEPGFDSTNVWLAQKMLYESLYNDTALLDSNSLMNTFYTSMGSSDIATILQSEIQNELLTDSANMADTVAYNKFLETAQSTSSGIPDTNIRAANYIAMSNIYLSTIAIGVNSFTNGHWIL
jgi:hypothetical protein